MATSLRALFRSRLILRLYLVGLAQIAVVAAGFAALLLLNRPEHHGPHPEGHAELLAERFAGRPADPVALAQDLEAVRRRIGMAASLVDAKGKTIATSASDAARRCDSRPGPPDEWRGCAVAPLALAGGERGELHLFLEGPPPKPPDVGSRIVPLVLLVVGISSFLLARSVTRPLARMSEAARAFGAGDLRARVGSARSDELGEMSRAFDEMADRVTELLRAEKELLANVSHELRTPLARIRVALDIASEGDAETARESLVDIAGDLDELERLITDILTAARLDLSDGSAPSSGIPPLRRQAIDVPELLAKAASRFRGHHPGRALDVDVPGDLPAVDGDPVLLRRVIDNLLENAHKYTERPGDPVALSARVAEGAEGRGRALALAIEIDVTDRGIGIAPADLPRVFRPFFRADRSRTRATGGLGLGLALAKRIVDAHGGDIELTSRLDEGTRARVRLPAAAPASAPAAA